MGSRRREVFELALSCLVLQMFRDNFWKKEDLSKSNLGFFSTFWYTKLQSRLKTVGCSRWARTLVCLH